MKILIFFSLTEIIKKKKKNMKPRQVLEIFTAAQRRTEPKSLVILRSFIAIFFFTILICYMFVQIGNFTYIFTNY